jgi:hypothetical protein
MEKAFYPRKECKKRGCEKVFQARSWNHVYCSDECSAYVKKEKKDHIKKSKAICDKCFVRCSANKGVRDGDEFFCTIACRDRYTIKQIKESNMARICQNPNCPVEVPEDHPVYVDYCSLRCEEDANNR